LPVCNSEARQRIFLLEGWLVQTSGFEGREVSDRWNQYKDGRHKSRFGELGNHELTVQNDAARELESSWWNALAPAAFSAAYCGSFSFGGKMPISW
jgi:hypothetical protein